MDFSLTATPPSPQPQALTVSQLVDRMKNAIRISVGYQWVEGEISNLRIQSSGHSYFTLKDVGAQISCVLFKGRASGCHVELKEGIKVRVYGEATMYEQRGQVQLVLSKIEPAGMGDLQARFLELKAKLEAEGLFDQDIKKQIPSFPEAIGLITSPTGAAIQDIKHVLEKRAPWVRVYLLPVLVQGDGAAKQIASAINKWSNPSSSLPHIDTLIIARGGGSIEDLWCFNEEIVARAIHECPLPVISGVGHETDFTIADFVADLRAPTPTAAAMLATPDGEDLSRRLESMGQTILRRGKQYYQHAALRLSFIERSSLATPQYLLEPFHQQMDDLEQDLFSAASWMLENKSTQLRELELVLKSKHPKLLNDQRKQRLLNFQNNLTRSVTKKISLYPQKIAFLEHQLMEKLNQRTNEAKVAIELLESRLETRNPKLTLERGFALLRDQSGKIIQSSSDTKSGDLLEITLKDGQIKARTE